jgi:hypothetical protein
VRGKSHETERTLGKVNVNITIGNYETDHKFQVIGDGINIQYGGILGKDFFESKQATIDYRRKEIIMGELKLKFDKETQPERFELP